MKQNVNFNFFVDVLKKKKMNFKIYLSQNSQVVIYQDEFTGELKKEIFSDKKINPKVFSISKKIKEETEFFLINNTRFKRRQDRHSIRYYHYDQLKDGLKHFYYIDLSSAYITSLLNNNIISKKLFNEINSLNKKERLIALGMLAYEPYEIAFIDGVQVEMKEGLNRINNYYSPVFFTACDYIQKVMEHVIKLLDGKFIFYWVDGIFFDSQEHFNLISDYLNTLKYQFKIGSCYDLKVIDKEFHYDIKFKQSEKKDGVYKLNPKNYSIPHYFREIEERKENYNLIINGDFDKLLANYKNKKTNKNSNN